MSAISAIVDSLEEARNQAVELVADSVGDPVAASPMNNSVDLLLFMSCVLVWLSAGVLGKNAEMFSV